MFARGDFANNPHTNGEYAILARLISSLRKTGCIYKTVLLDIGANIGSWSIIALDMASRLGVSDIEIHAFEPVPSTFNVLNSSIMSHSDCKVVHTSQLALSATEGYGEIYVFGNLAGTNSL